MEEFKAKGYRAWLSWRGEQLAVKVLHSHVLGGISRAVPCAESA